VIKVITASASDNTSLVGLEGALVGLNGNRNWLLSKSSHKSSLALWGNILVSGDLDTFAWVLLTVLVHSFV
jgi:hypothetical protein